MIDTRYLHFRNKKLITIFKNTTTLFSFRNMFDVSNIIICHYEYIVEIYKIGSVYITTHIYTMKL